MPRALVVADDLTGAMDTGHAFAVRGYRTRVQVDPGRAPPDSTVLAPNTDSRYADPETAAERVRRAIEAIDAPVVYKKVDSTLRRNVVSEVRSALSCGFEHGLFAPASSTVGRLTAGGYHLVEGRLLSDTEYADDPNGFASDHLPKLRVARIENTMEPDELLVSEPVARELDGRADVEVGELRPLAFEDGALSPLD